MQNKIIYFTTAIMALCSLQAISATQTTTTTPATTSVANMTLAKIPCYSKCDKKACKECACEGIAWYHSACDRCYLIDRKCVDCAKAHKNFFDSLSSKLKAKFCPKPAKSKGFWQSIF